MSSREQQQNRYWPTATACTALGGHKRTNGICRICGDTQPTTPTQQAGAR